jgi:hypothetical protein
MRDLRLRPRCCRRHGSSAMLRDVVCYSITDVSDIITNSSSGINHIKHLLLSCLILEDRTHMLEFCLPTFRENTRWFIYDRDKL